MKKLGFGIFLATVIAGGQLVYGDVMIDDFVDGNATLGPLAAAGSTSGSQVGTMVGGNRWVNVTYTAGSGNLNVYLNSGTYNDGRVGYEAGDTARGTLTLGYGSQGYSNPPTNNIPFPNMNLALNPGGEDMFRLSFVTGDQVGGTGTITVYSSTAGGAYTSSSFNIPVGGGLVDVPFGSFAGAPIGTWGDVDGIGIALDSTAVNGHDYSIGSITTTLIPETSSIVMGIGLLSALGFLGRRKQKKAA